ncbi:MAG: hypothetical protein GC134_06545 [Proteobacteria bacterium]|nr:hypothetical protein [Pseudomonadota bacterium]
MADTPTIKTRFWESMASVHNATDIIGHKLLSVVRFAAIRFADNWHALCRWLEKKGWKRLGNGYFANVYATPCGRFALKLARGGTAQGYDGYARYAMANPGNPYLPKVYLHMKTEFGMMTLLERLRPMGDALRDEYARICAALRSKDMPDMKDSTALVSLLRHLHGFGDRLDLHPTNFMARGKQLVITDPLAA